MDIFKKRFKSAKCKTTLNLLISRIKVVRSRHEIQLRTLRADIAQLLQKRQEDSALIRVENLIREQNMLHAFNIIETYCELLISRMSIIDSQKVCSTDLQEAVSSLLYAGPRCAKLPELMNIRKFFVRKYGQDFVTAAVELHPGCHVSKKITEKLSGGSASLETKESLFKKIAQENGFQWESPSQKSGSLKSSNTVPASYFIDNSKRSSLQSSVKEAAESQPGRSSLPDKFSLSQMRQSSDCPVVAPNLQITTSVAAEDKSSIRRNSTSNVSDSPYKPPSVSSAAHIEAPGDRQFVPFVQTDIKNSCSTISENGNIKEKQDLPSYEDSNPSTARNSAQSSVLSTQHMSGNQSPSKGLREITKNQPNYSETGQQHEREQEFSSSKSSYFEAVATAAEAAALSAENAAEAAKAAARLARSGLSQEYAVKISESKVTDHIRYTKIEQIQQYPQETSFLKYMDENVVEINSYEGSSWPTSATSRSNLKSLKRTETLDEDSDDNDASSHQENRSNYPIDDLDRTNTDSEEELEHAKLFVRDIQPREESSVSPKNLLSENYHYQQNYQDKANADDDLNTSSIQTKFSWVDDHPRASWEHSKLKPPGSWPKAGELSLRNKIDELFSTGSREELQTTSADVHRMQQFEGELSRPVFDEDFMDKSARHMDFYSKREENKYCETTREEGDDEEGIWWEKNKAESISKQIDEHLSPMFDEEILETGADEPHSKESIIKGGFNLPASQSSYIQNAIDLPNHNLTDDFERTQSSSSVFGTLSYGTSAANFNDPKKKYDSSVPTFENSLNSKPAHEGKMIDLSDFPNPRRVYNVAGKPRIGESVRSRRTR